LPLAACLACDLDFAGAFFFGRSESSDSSSLPRPGSVRFLSAVELGQLVGTCNFGKQVRLTLRSFLLELIPVFALKLIVRIIGNVTVAVGTPYLRFLQSQTRFLRPHWH
jgi:hypothetical protein